MTPFTFLDDALDIMTAEERQYSCAITDPNRPDNPVVYVTPEFERQTGYTASYTASEIIGRNLRLLQGPNTDPETVAEIRRAIDDMLPIKVEILNYRKDGTSFLNRIAIRPVFSEAGKLKSFVASQSIRIPEGLDNLMVAAE